jgi:YHS domain-containing protein
MRRIVALSVVAVLVLALSSVAMAATQHHQMAPKWFDKAAAVGTHATDPVSLGEVTVAKTTPLSIHGGKYYYFTSPADKKLFDENPAKYIEMPKAAPMNK